MLLPWIITVVVTKCCMNKQVTADQSATQRKMCPRRVSGMIPPLPHRTTTYAFCCNPIRLYVFSLVTDYTAAARSRSLGRSLLWQIRCHLVPHLRTCHLQAFYVDLTDNPLGRLRICLKLHCECVESAVLSGTMLTREMYEPTYGNHRDRPVRIHLAKPPDPKILRAMTRKQRGQPRQIRILGVEAGATRTVALFEQCDPESLEPSHTRREQFEPANLRLLDDEQLTAHFKKISRVCPSLDALAIAMAGARNERDRQRIRRSAHQVWPGVPCHATNDLESALQAADNPPRGPRGLARTRQIKGRRYLDGRGQHDCDPMPRVLILSGTGSCCFGRTRDGRTAKLGGWGHVLGDKGSGFEIGLRALKAVVYYHDRDGEWSELGRRILRKLQLNEPDDLIGWVQKAGKDEVAALAPEVFKAWSKRDEIASDILEGAANGLVNDAVRCAKRLVKPGAPVQFVLAGGVLLNQPRWAGKIARLLRRSWPMALVTALRRESAWGAVELAKREFQKTRAKVLARHGSSFSPNDPGSQLADSRSGASYFPTLQSLQRSPTEQRNARSMNLDRLAVADAIVLMLSEDAKIPSAILGQRRNVERAIKLDRPFDIP